MRSIVISLIAVKVILLMSLMAQMPFVEAIEVTEANFTYPIPPSLPVFYIRSDGSVEPPSAPLEQSGNTYYLTGEIVDHTIKIQKDNIILDGANKSIRASPVYTEALMLPVGWHPAIHLDKNNNVTIKNVKLQECYSAIYVEESKNITITDNNMISNDYGIVMRSSSSIAITKNNITKGSTGIIFYSSSNNTIVENNISSNIEGINFYSASTYNNYIKNNNLTANTGHAIFFNGGIVNHTITQNNIAYNRIGLGNDLPYRNCTIYSNNFDKNNESVQIKGVEAAWDKGGVGNYWSNYTGTDSNGDGIGDTPYIIDAYNKDNNPLMLPIDFTNTSPKPTPTPTVPELSWLVILPLLFTVFAIIMIIRHRKTANLNK
jgi:parallel beta-helix repeat protein